MQNQSFNKPVSIEFGRIGQIWNIGSAREAAERMLDERWPGHGPTDNRARRALLEALEGKADAAKARAAFRAAAKAAGILVER